MSQQTDKQPVYGVLLHLTHYDPAWMKGKEAEVRFDRALMAELVDLSAESGFNALIFDIADAVEYKTHPDLKRAYTVPMQELAELASRARDRGLEVIGKLNFSKSDRYRHNWWFRPYRELPDDDEYFQHAWQVIDEVLEAVEPSSRFHIGMDEDSLRDAEGYCQVIEKLHVGLAKRSKQTIIWSDSCHDWGETRNHILEAAWERLPRDITLMLWNYRGANPELVRRFVDMGYPVWGASGKDEPVARAWADAIRENGGSGQVATLWFPTQAEQREDWRQLISTSARAFKLRAQ